MGTLRTAPATSAHFIAMEERHGAHNTHPLPVVLSRGEGVHVWDVEGRRYIDFLAAYGALGIGHCHPRIVEALATQAQRLSLTSRSFYNDVLGGFEHRITTLFGYDKVLLMNTGGEAVETAIKLARKWGYEHKGIAPGHARVVVCAGNYHGSTLALAGASTDPETREGFGPFVAGIDVIPYNDIAALHRAVAHKDVVAFIVEPVQAEAGIIVPTPDYLPTAKTICAEHDVLLITDEVQTGLGRTGHILGADHDAVRPDMVILGKTLGGGLFPVSAVLADDEVMLGIKSSGQHGSTYAANPLAAAVAGAVLDVLEEEGLAAQATRTGGILREGLSALRGESRFIQEVRGRGLLNAMILSALPPGITAWDVCLRLRDHGLLAKPSHGDIIRLTPPLIISEAHVHESLDIIGTTLRGLA